MSRPSTYHASLTSHTTTSSLQSSTATTALQTRIAAKRAELENLKQLRDLSATLASQMSTLEQKLTTLRDGTEAVAHVLANWENVLGVIGLVGARAATLVPSEPGHTAEQDRNVSEGGLPETLVRIPVQERSGDEGNTAGE